MKRHTKIVLGSGLALLLLLIATVVYSIWQDSNLKSSYNQRADKDCALLEEETLRDVAALGGYVITTHRKYCEAGGDEAGGVLHYSNYIRAKISIENPTDAANLKAKFTALKDNLPAKDYNLNVQNILPSGENPPALCLETSRWLDKTAQTYLWNDAPPTRNSQFIEPGVSYSDWRCSDL
jgi:hypothetical protein